MIQKILNNMKNRGHHVVQEKPKWRPIANFDQYIRMKKIADEKLALASSDPEVMRAYNKQNQDRIIHLQETTPQRPARHVHPPRFAYTEEYTRVKIDLSVSKNGKVRVKLVQPMVYLHDNYWSKGICPPLKEYIINLKYSGYPEVELERCMKVHMEREKRKPELEEFIDKVFGSGRVKVLRSATHGNGKSH